MAMNFFSFSKTILYLSLFLLLLDSCKEKTSSSPCDSLRVIEDHLIPDSVLNYVANYENSTKVIFISSTGQEYPFDLTLSPSYYSVFEASDTCVYDSLSRQRIQGQIERREWWLENSNLFNSPLIVNAFPFPVQRTSFFEDFLTVSLGEYMIFKEENVLFFLNFNDKTRLNNYYDSLNLDNRMFYQVYESIINPSPAISIKYTPTEGIIYIRDTLSHLELFYLRTE